VAVFGCWSNGKVKRMTLRALSTAEVEYVIKPRQVHSFFCHLQRNARPGLLVIGKAQHRKNRRRRTDGLIIAALLHSHTHIRCTPAYQPGPRPTVSVVVLVLLT
jgi:hypothetical protein